MRVATIDIGTNTVLLLVAEQRSTGSGPRLVAVEEHATITRLGEGVDRTRSLAPGAIARTNACLDAYAEIVRHCGAERVAVVGTSAMRDAGGGEAVRAHVKDRFGVEARTISGEEEARLTFSGALSGLTLDPHAGEEVTVFDIGGGSTEVVRGSTAMHGAAKRSIAFAASYDVGSVRLTERLVVSDPPTEAERRAVLDHARGVFAAVPAVATPVVGIAGTITTLAAVSMKLSPYVGEQVHGHVLEVRELERVVNDLAQLPLAQRVGVPGLEPKRADVIIAGGLIALAFLAHVGARSLVVSDRGVRWGLAEELAGAS